LILIVVVLEYYYLTWRLAIDKFILQFWVEIRTRHTYAIFHSTNFSLYNLYAIYVLCSKYAAMW